MEKTLTAAARNFEMSKEMYRLYVQEHLSMAKIGSRFGVGRSTADRKIRTFVAENPELAEKMGKQIKEITPDDYQKLVGELAELKKQLKCERLRADFYEEMVAFGKEIYGVDLKKVGTK